MRRPRESRRDPVANWLRATVDELTAAAAAGAPALPLAALRWAAARRAAASAARARLAAAGRAVAGALFADAPAGASPERLAALRAMPPAPALPPSIAPPSLLALGALYPGLACEVQRKRDGAFFTPPELAEPTARRALGPLTTPRSPSALAPTGPALRVCDPAVGAGSFLLAALTVLRESTGLPARRIAEQCLFGFDVDPTAAHLAAWTLCEACGDDAPEVEAIERNVRAGDGLFLGDPGSFDAVLGNPPWETLQGRDDVQSATYGAALRERYARTGRGKLYTYRLFVERAVELLRAGGRLGLVVPASLYFDRDAAGLRTLLLDRCDWEWLYGFENRRRLFAIDGRYRFACIVAQKGGATQRVRAAFSVVDPTQWSAAAPPHFDYRRTDLEQLSPRHRTFVEVRQRRDLELLRHLHDRGMPLLGEHGLCRWQQGDFNMTSDAHRFVRRDDAEARGYRRCGERWRAPGLPDLRALIQGAMIGALHPNAGAYAGGTGRAVRWRAAADPSQREPQYLLPCDEAGRAVGEHRARAVLRALSNATNERTAVACLLGDEPCGNSLGVLTPRSARLPAIGTVAFAAGVLGSLVFDWMLRQRLAGTNVNGFVLADTVVPDVATADWQVVATLALQLSCVLPWHASLVDAALDEGWFTPPATTADRDSLHAQLELAVARAFALSLDDLRWMLRGCDLPVERLRGPAAGRDLDPRGFWRVDRDRPPAYRLPNRVLALAASSPVLHVRSG